MVLVTLVNMEDPAPPRSGHQMIRHLLLAQMVKVIRAHRTMFAVSQSDLPHAYCDHEDNSITFILQQLNLLCL